MLNELCNNKESLLPKNTRHEQLLSSIFASFFAGNFCFVYLISTVIARGATVIALCFDYLQVTIYCVYKASIWTKPDGKLSQ